MNVFAETKTNEEKEVYEHIWVRKLYHENKKGRFQKRYYRTSLVVKIQLQLFLT